MMYAITTNVQLKWYKIKESERCTFCESEKETLIHLFVRCKYVQPLWEMITEIFGINSITEVQVLFNHVANNPR